MLNIGLIIAAGVVVIYIILGPLVILGVYAFFDRLAEKAGEASVRNGQQMLPPHEKDPALWTDEEVRVYLAKKRSFSADTRRADD